jgi:hypothetical protein
MKCCCVVLSVDCQGHLIKFYFYVRDSYEQTVDVVEIVVHSYVTEKGLWCDSFSHKSMVVITCEIKPHNTPN